MGLGAMPGGEERLVPARMFLDSLRAKRRGEKAPTDWRQWLTTLFPKAFSDPLAPRHVELWRWVLGIRLDSSPPPFVGIWSRGGGKSTSAEAAVLALGVRGYRKYAIYVSSTQEQADKFVGNIASLFESSSVARYYPEHADRDVNKFGNPRGWRRSRLRTAGGFTVDALGLDTAIRGIKVDEQRPDLICLDDIDQFTDTPATTKKKRDTLAHSVLPAGSKNAAVLAIQNLIIPHGIFAQLADGRADFLVDRILSGPHPAIEDLEYEWRAHPVTGIRRAVITKGVATWPGQSLERCQAFIERESLPAFLRECQHEVYNRSTSTALRFIKLPHPDGHMVEMSDEEVRAQVKERKVTLFGGIDFGSWRFAFTLWGVDRDRVVTRIDEFFSQKESLTDRAIKIHDMCEWYGVEGLVPIWGDAANPTDIAEMNSAFVRGWDENGRHIVSKRRVVAVGMENKMRKVAVERINNALDHRVLRFRTNADGDPWRFNANAASDGTEMTGSRLLWEIDAWRFPVPKEGEAQDQNPDDDTADGADMIASMRYALMSHWKAAKAPVNYGAYENDRLEPFDYKTRKFVERPHAIDLLQSPGNRRSPRVSAPRPRLPGIHNVSRKQLDDDYIDLAPRPRVGR